MPDRSLIAEFEAEIRDVLQQMYDIYRDEAELLGTRPFGFKSGDQWDQAAQYLDVRDSPDAWEGKIAELAQSVGRETAELVMMNEATRMEGIIADLGGYEAVQTGLFARRLREVEPAMKAMKQTLAKPKAQILPPFQPVTDLDLLSQMGPVPGTGGADAGALG